MNAIGGGIAHTCCRRCRLRCRGRLRCRCRDMGRLKAHLALLLSSERTCSDGPDSRHQLQIVHYCLGKRSATLQACVNPRSGILIRGSHLRRHLHYTRSQQNLDIICSNAPSTFSSYGLLHLLSEANDHGRIGHELHIVYVSNVQEH